MPISTLTTDFGITDYYVAVLKGSILSKNEGVSLIDISNDVESYDITMGAYLLKNAYGHFPKDSIHIIAVNSFYTEVPRFLCVRHNGHYFIGPDNGIFSLLFEAKPAEMFELEGQVLNLAGLCELYASATYHITQKLPIEEIGPIVGNYNERITLQPVITSNQIRGSVVHIDKYDNVVLNITRELFDRVHKGRNFELYFKRHDPILDLCEKYSDVAPGETLCLFNGSNQLEIAVNFGQAATLLGLEIDDTVQINFA